jgi:hypothetical protein
MSDPAKSAGDIDDVLSSIRRLVAEQPDGIPRVGQRSEPAGAVKDDKLVLTPALRVSEPEMTGATAEELQIGAEDAPDGSATDESGPALAAMFASPADADEASAGMLDDTISETLDGTPHEASSGSDDAEFATSAPASEEPSATGRPDVLHLGQDAVVPTDDDEAEAGARPPASDVSSDTDEVAQAEPGEDVVVPAETDANAAAVAESGGSTEAEARSPDEADGDGWRPEMRMLDWLDRAPEDGEDPVPAASDEFEPDTGDANWPDDGANRALLDLAAAREAAADDAGSGAVDGRGAATAKTGFTPIFSRRSGETEAVKHAASADEAGKAGQATGLSMPESEVASEPAAQEAADGPEGASGKTASDVPSAFEPGQPPASDFDSEAAAEAETGLPDSESGDDIDAAGGAVGESETDASAADSADRDVLADDDIAAEAPEDASPVTGQSVFAEVMETDRDRQAARADAADHVDVSDADASEGAGPVASATVQEDTADEEAALEGAVAAGVASAMAEVDEGAEMDRDRADGVDLGADEEGFLDEETLRRIVAEVVREELQGALGERITRNVRKLVRREIRLVLAADELD